jgi:hypothetical protein
VSLVRHPQGRSGSPVGWIYPSFHASSRQRNKATDRPTRTASARAIRRLRSASDCAFLSLRNMKNSAAPKLAMMAKKANATRYPMKGIMW